MKVRWFYHQLPAFFIFSDSSFSHTFIAVNREVFFRGGHHAKSWLIGKDSDAGRDWGQEEKGTTEDEMAGWHHWLNGHASDWTPGVGDGQGGLACCDSWGHKESDMTERLIWSDLIRLLTTICSKRLNFMSQSNTWHVSITNTVAMEPYSRVWCQHGLLFLLYSPKICYKVGFMTRSWIAVHNLKK